MTKPLSQFHLLRLKFTMIFALIGLSMIVCFNIAVIGSFRMAREFFLTSFNTYNARNLGPMPVLSQWLLGDVAIHRINPDFTPDNKNMVIIRFNSFQRNFERNLLVFDIIILLMVIVLGYYYTDYVLKPVELSVKNQENFILDASHELKTPVATILSEVEALRLTQGKNLSLEVAAALEVIESETQNLSNLSQTLLDLTKIDSDQIQLCLLDLSTLIKNQTKNFRSRAQQLNLELVTEISPHVEIMGNRQQLAQLLNLLVDNALKYTPQNGTVTIVVRTDKKLAFLEVKDTGVGIAPADHGRIFNRFYRAKNKSTLHEDGSGLGLAIAQKIAQQHKAHIKVISQLDKGATFRIDFPLVKS